MKSDAHPAVRLVTTAERVSLLQAWDAHMPVSQRLMGAIIESFPVETRMGSNIDGFKHAATSGFFEMLVNVKMHPLERLAT